MATTPREIAAAIRSRRSGIAAASVDAQYRLDPALEDRHGPGVGAERLEQASQFLDHLAGALAAASPTLFTDYVRWTSDMQAARLAGEELGGQLNCLREALRECLVEGMAEPPTHYVEQARVALRLDDSICVQARIETGTRLGQLTASYLEELLGGNHGTAGELIREAVGTGTPIQRIYLEVLQPAQREVGKLWQEGRISVAEEHACTAATQRVMGRLYPHVFNRERNGRTAVVTCVSHELHEVGARMVDDFLEMSGWQAHFLGANTPTPAIVSMAHDRGADLVAISCTMVSHLDMVAELTERLRRECHEGMKILVGGYPFLVDPQAWRRVGADATARDAREATRVADRLVGELAAN